MLLKRFEILTLLIVDLLLKTIKKYPKEIKNILKFYEQNMKNIQVVFLVLIVVQQKIGITMHEIISYLENSLMEFVMIE
jgi:uncharacterized protein YybS (DUF2232 family)